MFIFFSTFFVIINLIGIFQLITLMKTLFEFLKNCIIIFFTLDENNIDDDKKEELKQKYNFFELFSEKSKNNEIDFNLMMITNFFGEILLKSRGFRVSLFLFMIINCIPLFLIINFNFDSYEKNFKYSGFKILYLLVCYIGLLIGIGSSSLLSQKILIDSFLKYKNYIINIKKMELEKEKEKEMEKNKKQKFEKI